MDLNNITLISVACVRVEETILALKHSMSNLNFGSVKLLTSETIEDSEIDIIKIQKLDYEGYNKFIVYELHKYVDTDYVLIIQDDGYIINPNLWKEEFLNYDYIGAPWPIPTDNFSFRDVNNNIVRVGNGGFSLRSKKLLALPTLLDLKWKEYYGFYNEDGFIAVHNRHILEKEGCIFAPLSLAIYFSHESDIEENKNIIPFGFHGKWSKYKKNLK
jgi:hypothetical protein